MFVPEDLFCDGGLIGRNPSKLGGTWAWCWIRRGDGGLINDTLAKTDSGTVTPEQAGLEAITNNYTELLAAILCLESLPEGWSGTIHTDSYVTLCRIIPGGVGKKSKPSFKNIPTSMQQRVEAIKLRLGKYSVNLLGGHPSKADLLLGKRGDGLPVSPWNVWCDHRCNEEAEKFRAAIPWEKA